MERRLTDVWYRESAGVSLLAPLSWLYGAVVQTRRGAYARGWLRAYRMPRPVVVVGNLTVGGTGKTPFVIWLAQKLTEDGLKVGLVSRGYGRERDRDRAIAESPSNEPLHDAERQAVELHAHRVYADSSWREAGDEPVLLMRRTGCATVVARDRVAGAQALVALDVDVIVADDGLQHLRLARDLEIVLVDGGRGFGNGRLLPAGPLREPVSRLRQADVVVVNGAAEHASLARGDFGPGLRTLHMTVTAEDARPVDGLAAPRPLDSFRGQRVHAVAGIGNPARYFRDLRSRGLELIEHGFPDHHPFSAADLSFDDTLPILMTEKDAVRAQALATPRMWYVPITAHLSDADARTVLSLVTERIAP
jgi:tetraacyldisaccharide 4'-kinase